MITYKTKSHLKTLITGSGVTLGLIAAISQPIQAQATHVAQDWSQSTSVYGNDSLKEFLPRLRSALDQANKSTTQKQP
ncbi:MAG: hypothetical protein EOP04_31715, partial [Proteobacteria bacterium]